MHVLRPLPRFGWTGEPQGARIWQVTRLPGIGAATRFGVSRTAGLTVSLARAALPRDADREAFRRRATDALSQGWETTIDLVLRARLIERTADRLLADQVVERVAILAVEHPATERVLSRMVESPGLEHLLDRVIESPRLEQLVTRVIESPGLERLVTDVAETPGFERLVLSIANSERFDRLLDRVLASEQLDRVVTQIAESDEVYDALRQQSQGMADEVTDELRSRTIAADALLERIARAVVRRRPAPGDAGTAGTGAI